MAKKKKTDMGFESITITVVKNGYLVEGVDPSDQFVFDDVGKITKWSKEAMAPFTEVRDFIEAL